MSQDMDGQAVQLALMPQLLEAKNLEDDWTGLTDPVARRRIQTRLNTRAYRRRKAEQAAAEAAVKAAEEALAAAEAEILAHRPLFAKAEEEEEDEEEEVPCWVETKQSISMLPTTTADSYNCCGRPLLSPSTTINDVIFPLSKDHLIILVQINVVRGCLTNHRLIGGLVPPAPRDCTNASISIFPGATEIRELPPNLYPTVLQCAKRHGNWIDVLPHPVWRDNLLSALGRFSPEDFGNDIIGGLFTGAPAEACEMRGLLVWSDPWYYTSWEISEGFIKKWGWTLIGCEDMIAATNEWRRKRGELPISLDLASDGTWESIRA
ncbi:hypothetical protein B0I35DRAFT_467528 [Stachybotrys elegans]|uniref:BZIP domain-containing protein n=1 Tax=Stachybotrys elegans TaxID=80388 RepID=A0A8K0WU24_9HYPO|nr:hypothetical protein B0I35DRAFT_467528 [Stachybotrys elegans]